jgi:hypothetical protein|nr:MAG: capsid protein [Cressdnaviricota sp.]
MKGKERPNKKGYVLQRRIRVYNIPRQEPIARHYQLQQVQHQNINYIPAQAINRPMPLFRAFAAKNNKQSVKTVDQTYQVALAVPYVPDLMAPTVINIDTTGAIQNLCTVQMGTGEYNRIGNKIALKSLRLRFNLTPNNNNVITFSNARLMVIYDRQPNAAYPNLTSMLNTARQDGTSVNGTMWSNINVNLFERFIVLMDDYIPVPPNAIVGLVAGSDVVGPTELKSFQVDKYIKLKNLETVFQSTASPITIANIQTGALYLVSIGDLGGGAAPWSWKGETRLRYKDC